MINKVNFEVKIIHEREQIPDWLESKREYIERDIMCYSETQDYAECSVIAMRLPNGEILIESDDSPPEDKNLSRDLSFIKDWVRAAYDAGLNKSKLNKSK
jgi:hypothetical protein